MAESTPIYGLPTGVVTDDFIEPSHHNRVVDTLDRVMGNFLQKIMADGACNGWELTEDAQVTAGDGIVAACYCKTVAAQDISSLTNNAVNYIFGHTTGQSSDEGAIAFSAQISPSKPAGAIFLGTITLDEQGEITSYDSDASGVDRNLMLLEIGTVAGAGVVEAVPPDTSIEVTVDHSAEMEFVVPGAIDLQVAGECFEYEAKETYKSGSFVITATNICAEAEDFSYSWTRQGFKA